MYGSLALGIMIRPHPPMAVLRRFPLARWKGRRSIKKYAECYRMHTEHRRQSRSTTDSNLAAVARRDRVTYQSEIVHHVVLLLIF